MAVYPFKVGPYARKIYLYGTERFTARDTFAGIPLEYHQPVKSFAANNFMMYQIDNALAENWLTQEEYDDTVVLAPEIPVEYSQPNA